MPGSRPRVRALLITVPLCMASALLCLGLSGAARVRAHDGGIIINAPLLLHLTLPFLVGGLSWTCIRTGFFRATPREEWPWMRGVDACTRAGGAMATAAAIALCWMKCNGPCLVEIVVASLIAWPAGVMAGLLCHVAWLIALKVTGERSR